VAARVDAPTQQGSVIPTSATHARPPGSAAAAAGGPAAPVTAERLRATAICRAGRAFTYIELLISIGIISILVALILPVIGKSRASAQSVSCLSNLRQIASGFTQYAADNDHVFPDPFVVERSWEQLLRPYVASDGAFHCAGDDELFPMIGSSYDWRDTGEFETTLAGRRLNETNRPDCVLAFEALPGWHAAGRMNAALLDGSASSMEQAMCMEDLYRPIRGPLLVQPQGRAGAPR
jgi:hypothetical protein